MYLSKREASIKLTVLVQYNRIKIALIPIKLKIVKVIFYFQIILQRVVLCTVKIEILKLQKINIQQ